MVMNPRFNCKEMDLHDGEFITNVNGNFDDLIRYLRIGTNFGKNVEWNDGTIHMRNDFMPFSFQGHRLLFISGRAGDVE